LTDLFHGYLPVDVTNPVNAANAVNALNPVNPAKIDCQGIPTFALPMAICSECSDECSEFGSVAELFKNFIPEWQ